MMAQSIAVHTVACYSSLIAGSWGQHGTHMGPAGPRWAPCRPHELCYLGLSYRFVAAEKCHAPLGHFSARTGLVGMSYSTRKHGANVVDYSSSVTSSPSSQHVGLKCL